MVLRYTLGLIQALHVPNDEENYVDFYISVFPGEAKMCLGFMSFRAPPAALEQKNEHNSTNMQPIITYFQGQFNFMDHHILVICSK